ncbi:MAG: tRNA adenosine(34) deaminase TadA [Gammaproteobacteria bacterium TMED95]|nr:MAG: tRNA adenosine(34) deaminase TadA [Gammaproteobacteria bacterium TMED95]
MTQQEALQHAEDNSFMRLALQQAELAQSLGEVPVGAIAVAGGEVIGAGHNRLIVDHDPTAHAEMVALRSTGFAKQNYRLPEVTLYVTLEPCAMCAGAMIHARVQTLVFAAREPRAGAIRSQQRFFESDYLNHRVAVREGILAEESAGLLKAFFRQRRKSSGVA